jgi:hypothetical protein
LAKVIRRNRHTDRIFTSCKNGRIKPNKLENAVHGIYAEVENSDAVDTQSDKSGSDVETPTMSAASATSILWTYNISPHIFKFTGDC